MTHKTKPYSVWAKFDHGWQKLFKTHCPPEASDYAMNRICHGNVVKRIEIRDLTGPLDTVYDSNWPKRH